MNGIPTYLDFYPLQRWVEIKDGDPRGLELFKRHYSKYQYKDGRQPKLFVGPGEKTVLISKCGQALFVWRKFKSMDNQSGINCSIFRNESSFLSSELVGEAVQIAWKRWPNERLYTYVNPRKIKSSNPGCCFKKAGFVTIGITKVNRLLILELCPDKKYNQEVVNSINQYMAN